MGQIEETVARARAEERARAKPPTVTQLLTMLEDCELRWQGPHSPPYLGYMGADGYRVWIAIKGGEVRQGAKFRGWVADRAVEQFGAVPKRTTVTALMAILKSRAVTVPRRPRNAVLVEPRD